MLLSVEDVHVRYGQAAAVDGVTLQVDRGELVALLGANGAGKSTLLRALGGLVHPWRGRVVLDGEDITRSGADGVARRGLSLVPEGRAIFPRLSVEENLRMGGYHAAGEYEDRREHALRHFPVLEQRRRQAAGSLSGGEQQQLAIARALMTKPRLLLLDELSLGLAPRVVAELFEVLRQINAAGTAVLLVEQQVQNALELATRAYVMDRGRTVLQGPASRLAEDAAALRSAYLGGGAGTPAAGGAATGQDVTEIEQLAVPLGARDRRTLQVLADRRGTTVGRYVGSLLAEHAEQARARAALAESAS